jgi:transposase-like protein
MKDAKKRLINQILLSSINMVTLKLSEKQLDDLYEEMFSNDKARGRKKCLVVYLRAKGRPCHEIADIARVDEGTVTNTVKKIRRGRLGRFVKRTLP